MSQKKTKKVSLPEKITLETSSEMTLEEFLERVDEALAGSCASREQEDALRLSIARTMLADVVVPDSFASSVAESASGTFISGDGDVSESIAQDIAKCAGGVFVKEKAVAAAKKPEKIAK